MRAPRSTHSFARKLRSQLSLPEKLLWVRLRRREPGRPVFRRQHAVGPYVLDFYCAEARLCLEVDGGSHGFGDRPQRDERRDAWLCSQGIEVIRVSAAAVLRDPEHIAEWMLAEARERIELRPPSAPSV